MFSKSLVISSLLSLSALVNAQLTGHVGPLTSSASKAAKKTKSASGGDDTKKKRRKTRKETYSSYIYKGV